MRPLTFMRLSLALLLIAALAVPAWPQSAPPRPPAAAAPADKRPPTKAPAPAPKVDARAVLQAMEEAFSAVADRVTPAVVNVSTVSKRAVARLVRRSPALPRVLRRRVLRALLQAAAARRAAGERLGRHRGSSRIHLDEQSRYRERSGHHRAPVRLPEVHGHAGRSRSQDRPGGAQGRGPGPAAGGRARRLRAPAGRPVGHRHRQPVRSRPHRHGRHRVGHGPHAGGRDDLRELHPDRRLDQSRQLRRAAC